MAPEGDRLDISYDSSQGLDDDTLSSRLDGVSPEARMEAINKLTAAHRLSLFQSPFGLAYKGIEAEETAR